MVPQHERRIVLAGRSDPGDLTTHRKNDCFRFHGIQVPMLALVGELVEEGRQRLQESGPVEYGVESDRVGGDE